MAEPARSEVERACRLRRSQHCCSRQPTPPKQLRRLDGCLYRRKEDNAYSTFEGNAFGFGGTASKTMKT